KSYWRKVPSVKRLVFRSVPEGSTRLAMLKRGEVDVAYLLEGELGESIRNDPKLKLAFSGGVATFLLDFFDMWDPKSPWADQRVRKAASLAIDRKAVSDADTLGASKPNGQHCAQALRICAADRPRSLRSGAGEEAACRGGLPERVRRRRSVPLAALLQHRRIARELSRRGRHQNEIAHDGAGGVLLRAPVEEAQARVLVQRRHLWQRLA